jgi:hypothetical protein
MVLKKIGPLSLAKIGGVIYGVLGFLVGIFISMLAMLGVFASSMTSEGPGPIVGMFLGVGAIIMFPILYSILGFVMGAIVAWLYNVFAGLVGGIELDLQ